MDIYSFVNSKDIREHLRSIGYEFSPLETAWLIFRCNELSYHEKRAAWIELIETAPDCDVEQCLKFTGCDSLHQFLRRYIEILDAEIADFFEAKAAGEYVYSYEYLCKGDAGWCEEYETIFPSLDACMRDYKGDIREYDDFFKVKLLRYRIRRQRLSDPNEVIEIEFFPDDRIVDVMYNMLRSDEERKVVEQSIEDMKFDIPTPFHEGDILWLPNDGSECYAKVSTAFALESLITWQFDALGIKPGDYFDMEAVGYFVNEDGTVYRDVRENYMDFEYYHGPYKSYERVLLALSKFLKKENTLAFLLCAYRNLLLDVASEDPQLIWFDDELLHEVGLELK